MTMTDPIFGDIDNVPAPEGGDTFGDDYVPAPGSYVFTFGDCKFFKSKAGKLIFLVEFVLDSGDKWADVRVLAGIDGRVNEGAVKSAKFALRQLGLDPNQPASTWAAQLSTLAERRGYCDVVHNPRNDGGFFVNTNVTALDPSTPPREVPVATAEAAVPWAEAPVAPAPLPPAPQQDATPPVAGAPVVEAPAAPAAPSPF